MTETQQDLATQWPNEVNDHDHPFGEITLGAQLCAYCCTSNLNAAFPVRVEMHNRNTDGTISSQHTWIRAGEARALLAAGCWPEKFRVVDPSGQIMSVLAVTTIAGTAVCKWHAIDQIRKLR